MEREWWHSPEIAKGYEKWYRTPRGRIIAEQEKALLSSLLPGNREGRLLEVGCGTGYFTRFFSSLGYDVVGLDISFAMLSEARKNERLPYILGDAAMLPFASSSFDIVSAITTLEFIKEPAETIGEMFRVGRGMIILGVLNSLSPTGMRRRIELLLGRENPYRYARFYSPFNLRRLVLKVAEERGIRVKEILYRTTVFPGKRSLSPLFLPVGAFIGLVASFEK